jgi:hypothetical protein
VTQAIPDALDSFSAKFKKLNFSDTMVSLTPLYEIEWVHVVRLSNGLCGS